MEIHLIELSLNGSLCVLEDEGYLIIEGLSNQEHGLIELTGGL